jgi:hypothetical protein
VARIERGCRGGRGTLGLHLVAHVRIAAHVNDRPRPFEGHLTNDRDNSDVHKSYSRHIPQMSADTPRLPAIPLRIQWIPVVCWKCCGTFRPDLSPALERSNCHEG